MLLIDIIPTRKDNYSYFLQDENTGKTAIVDAGEADPILDYLSRKRLSLDYLLITHHHGDHTAGISDIKHATTCQVVGFSGDQHRIALDIPLNHQDMFNLGNTQATILHIPGHTSGQIAFYFAEDRAVFTGDTLFSVGCGYLFEGSYEEMYHSLQQLSALPGTTRLYPGHEYTEKNIQFALTLEPHNQALLEHQARVAQLRKNHLPSVPSTMELEKSINPFLRTNSPAIQKQFGLSSETDPVKIFQAIRERKNSF